MVVENPIARLKKIQCGKTERNLIDSFWSHSSAYSVLFSLSFNLDKMLFLSAAGRRCECELSCARSFVLTPEYTGHTDTNSY